MWQTFVHECGLSKKFANGDMIVPRDFQRGKHDNKQPKVVKFGYPTFLVGNEKC
jgi:hypothetical protein